MKDLYFDLKMGAAGDMMAAGLLELFDNPKEVVQELNGLNIPGVEFVLQDSFKCGIKGSSLIVNVKGEVEGEHDHHDHDHEHHHDHDHHHTHVHRNLKDIEDIVLKTNLSTSAKEDVMKVYKLIAVAESISHNVGVTEIHFHEVGMMDAIADISAVCYLIEKLNPRKIYASKVNLGGGTVRCAHGILPVPAPATAYILKDVPVYQGAIESELTTPTGAALLKHFVDEFIQMPTMKIEKIGYGMGKKDFEVANALRVFAGETENKRDVIYELSCNVDDMCGEEISYAMDMLFKGGAREVYTVPIGMKKSRPGHLIRVMCTEDYRQKMVELIFKYTTTIGIREVETHRYVLDRKIETVETKFGEVHVKKSSGYGVDRCKYEYEDLKQIADRENLSISEVKKLIGG